MMLLLRHPDIFNGLQRCDASAAAAWLMLAHGRDKLLGELAATLDVQAPGLRQWIAYHDDGQPERACDRCGQSYRGPALYCSLACAQADA
jgi:hypothetical protein